MQSPDRIPGYEDGYWKRVFNQLKRDSMQTENQYAPMMNMSKIDSATAKAQADRARATLDGGKFSYLPLEMALKQAGIQIEGGKLKNSQERLSFDKDVYSPAYLAARIKLMQQQADNPGRYLSAQGKRAEEELRVKNGLLPDGRQNDVNNLATTPPAIPPINPVNTAAPVPISQPPAQGQQQSAGTGQALSPKYQLTPEQIAKLANILGVQGGGQAAGAQGAQPKAVTPAITPQQEPDYKNMVKTEAGDYLHQDYAKNPVARQYAMMANIGAAKGSQQQFNAARQLEGFLQDPATRRGLAAYVQYAGLTGRAKGFIDSLKRDKPEEYQAFLAAKDITVGMIANITARMEKLGVQQEIRAGVHKMFDGALAKLTTDPKTSLYLINSALSMVNNYSHKVYADAQPINQVFVPSPYEPITIDAAEPIKNVRGATTPTQVAQPKYSAAQREGALAELRRRGDIK